MRVTDQVRQSYQRCQKVRACYENISGWAKSFLENTEFVDLAEFRAGLDKVSKSGDDLLLSLNNLKREIELHLQTREDLQSVSASYVDRVTSALLAGQRMVAVGTLGEPTIPLEIPGLDRQIISARDEIREKIIAYNNEVRQFRLFRRRSGLASWFMGKVGIPDLDDFPVEIDLSEEL